MLELMGKLRPHTYGAELGGDHSRAVALHALKIAIDEIAVAAWLIEKIGSAPMNDG